MWNVWRRRLIVYGVLKLLFHRLTERYEIDKGYTEKPKGKK